MRMGLVRGGLVVGAAALCVALPSSSRGNLSYTAPSGDLNQDQNVDVLDVQCLTLLFKHLASEPAPPDSECASDAACVASHGPDFACRLGPGALSRCLPICLAGTVSVGESPAVTCNDPAADTAVCLGKTQKRNADMNCDGALTATDFIFLVAVIMSKTGGPDTPDIDGDDQLNFCDGDMDGDGVGNAADNCPLAPDPTQADFDEDGAGDACDSDDDGDGDPDASDCGPLDPGAANGLVEICDGVDNDCDGKIDQVCPDRVVFASSGAGAASLTSGLGSFRLTVGQPVAGRVQGAGIAAGWGLGECGAE